jgi:uncharacterized protein
MGGVPPGEEGGMRKRRKKNRTRTILITATIGALIAAVLIVTAILLHMQGISGKKPAPERTPVPQTIPQATIQRVIQGEQLLIKGCLFDLGIPRENVRITGRTVNVTVAKEIGQPRILGAFTAIDDVEDVEVSIPEPTRVVVIINAHEWEIIFHLVSKPEKKLASIAIIIDDMGLDMDIARQFGAINADLTFSILPQQPHTEEVARFLHAKGREILLHLPMEGNGKNPGPGAIYRDMDPAQAVSLLRESLKEVPYIDGVNNHMGSVVTQDTAIMRALLITIKERGLFFVDSLTISNSVCGEVASEVDVPFEVRDVFLDNEQTYAYISGQLDELIMTARRHGKAIGICHPHPVTAQVLAQEIPKLKARGIAVVHVSELVHRRG